MSSGGGTRSEVLAISFRSPPEQKAWSPAPVNTTTRASGSALNLSNAARSPSLTGRLMALCTLGRLSVIHAIWLRISYKTAGWLSGISPHDDRAALQARAWSGIWRWSSGGLASEPSCGWLGQAAATAGGAELRGCG